MIAQQAVPIPQLEEILKAIPGIAQSRQVHLLSVPVHITHICVRAECISSHQPLSTQGDTNRPLLPTSPFLHGTQSLWCAWFSHSIAPLCFLAVEYCSLWILVCQSITLNWRATLLPRKGFGNLRVAFPFCFAQEKVLEKSSLGISCSKLISNRNVFCVLLAEICRGYSRLYKATQSSWNYLQRSLPHLLLVASAASLAIIVMLLWGRWEAGLAECCVSFRLCFHRKGFAKTSWIFGQRAKQQWPMELWMVLYPCFLSLCEEVHPFPCTICKCSRNETKPWEDGHFVQISCLMDAVQDAACCLLD